MSISLSFTQNRNGKEEFIEKPKIWRRKVDALGFYYPRWSEMSPKSRWNDKFDQIFADFAEKYIAGNETKSFDHLRFFKFNMEMDSGSTPSNHERECQLFFVLRSEKYTSYSFHFCGKHHKISFVIFLVIRSNVILFTAESQIQNTF